MKYGSVCSGIESLSQAWEPLGMVPQFFSEIEPFPCAILNHYYPHVPNLGDMNNYKEWPNATIDVLGGGTPCQSHSIAGLRQGIADPRGELMFVFGAVADRFKPTWILWENVTGVLSVNGGRDFGSFLGMLAELGYGYAYRVLDAQYIRTQRHSRAVPQRRRRVFVVGYIGDWRPSASVLFERKSLSWDSPPCRKARQGVASHASDGSGGSSLCRPEMIFQPCSADGHVRVSDPDLCPTLDTMSGGNREPCICFQQNSRDEVRQIGEDGQIAGSLNSEIGMKQQNFLSISRMQKLGMYEDDNVASAIKARDFKDATDLIAVEADRVFGIPGNWIGRTPDNGGNATTPMLGVSPNLNCSDRHAVAFNWANGGGYGKANEGLGISLEHTPPHTTSQVSAVATDVCVRRLTPLECERLQGFPDNYTQIPWNGKEAKDCPDGLRYKALGNTMAVNVMTWLGMRIKMVDALIKEMKR